MLCTARVHTHAHTRTAIEHGFPEGRVKRLLSLSLRDATEGLALCEAFTEAHPTLSPACGPEAAGKSDTDSWLCPLSQVRRLWSGRRRPPEATPKDKQNPQDRGLVTSTSPAQRGLSRPHGAPRSVLCTRFQLTSVCNLVNAGPPSG